MKFVILNIIRIYQIFVPKRFHGRCLFNESCSNYVYRETKEKGSKAGIIALNYRIGNCRPNYFLTENNGKILLITARNQVVEEEYIDKRILMEKQTHAANSKISASQISVLR
jgi:putative component of membrane protein insertase Oxa1/YidC/SpoIIIJ protein YidD